MLTLESITQTVYEQIYPNPSDETPVDFEIFFEAAKAHYAYKVWELNRLDANSFGENNIPSSLLGEAVLNVINGRADISELDALTSLPSNSWIKSIGGFECGDCKYKVMDFNKWQLLCNDESRKIGDKVVVPVGSNLLFIEGTFGNVKEVPIIYANKGKNASGETLIDDALGATVRKELLKEFSNKFIEDNTNNSNGDN